MYLPLIPLMLLGSLTASGGVLDADNPASEFLLLANQEDTQNLFSDDFNDVEDPEDEDYMDDADNMNDDDTMDDTVDDTVDDNEYMDDADEESENSYGLDEDADQDFEFGEDSNLDKGDYYDYLENEGEEEMVLPSWQGQTNRSSLESMKLSLGQDFRKSYRRSPYYKKEYVYKKKDSGYKKKGSGYKKKESGYKKEDKKGSCKVSTNNPVNCNCNCNKKKEDDNSVYNPCGDVSWTHDEASGNCYQVVSTKMNWEEARVNCIIAGGDLASILCEREQLFIRGLLEVDVNVQNGVWMGLNDIEKEGTYVWSDKSKVSYTNWKTPNQPDNENSNEDCGEIVKKSGWNFQWNDGRCTRDNYSICKKKVGGYGNGVSCDDKSSSGSCTEVATTSPVNCNCNCYDKKGDKEKDDTPDDNPCGDSWIYSSVTGKCYKFILEEQSWEDAKYACRVEGGDLASVLTKVEQKFIEGFAADIEGLTNDFWIGYNDIDTEDVFLWSDGYRGSYTNWKEGRPKDEDPEQDCAVMRESDEYVWKDIQCSHRRPGLCKRKVSGSNDYGYGCKSSTGSDTCGDDSWTRDVLSGNCYKVESTFLNWNQARAVCISKGGDLASVLSQHEHDFIVGLVISEGGTVVGDGIDIWIGLNDKNVESKYFWSDGNQVSYFNWFQNVDNPQPNNQGGKQHCVELYEKEGYGWNDKQCSEENPFVCKKKADNPCGSGSWTYDVSTGNCYQVVSTKVTWEQARDICRSFYGDLTSILSDQEQEFIKDLANSVDTNRGIWIGLNDKSTEGEFEWTDGTEFTAESYENWLDAQPDAASPSEDCGELWKTDEKDFGWNDASCSHAQPFVCKKRASCNAGLYGASHGSRMSSAENDKSASLNLDIAEDSKLDKPAAVSRVIKYRGEKSSSLKYKRQNSRRQDRGRLEKKQRLDRVKYRPSKKTGSQKKDQYRLEGSKRLRRTDRQRRRQRGPVQPGNRKPVPNRKRNKVHTGNRKPARTGRSKYSLRRQNARKPLKA